MTAAPEDIFDPETWGDDQLQIDSDQPEVVLEHNEVRLVEKYQKWTREITPQPQFGANLASWMASNHLDAKQLAILCKCAPATVTKWLSGGVPGAENQKALREAGFTGDFWPEKWSQSQFVRAELVRIRNNRFKPEQQNEEREFLYKYAVVLKIRTVAGRGKARQVVTEEREFLFSNRVTEVIKVLSDGDAIANWQCCQGLSHALGEPVLRGTAYVDGVLQTVEKRGSWRLLLAWQKKCLSSEISMDHSQSYLHPKIDLRTVDFMDIHQRSFFARNRKRDEAGALGTRAHKLGQAWLKFHALQYRDELGNPLIDFIRAPAWFWDPKDRRPDIYEIDLFFEPIEVQNALKALQTFLLENNSLEIVATEELLADVVHGVAGAVDCIVRDHNNDLIFLDWKTSNGVYPPMLLQLAWYARLWWLCRGVMPVRAYIVRLDKQTAEVQVVPAWENPAQRQRLLEATLLSIHFYNFLADMNTYLEDLKDRAKEQDKNV